jgi:hypothetical protein
MEVIQALKESKGFRSEIRIEQYGGPIEITLKGPADSNWAVSSAPTSIGFGNSGITIMLYPASSRYAADIRAIHSSRQISRLVSRTARRAREILLMLMQGGNAIDDD